MTETLTAHTDEADQPTCSTECADRAGCDVCDQDVCAEHTFDVAKCAGAGYHHDDCVDSCEECQWARYQDAAEDRAIEQWKGMW